MRVISVRILGYKKSQRYAIWRTLMQAQKVFEQAHPDFSLDVHEVTTAADMLQFTPVIAFPSLMLNEKLVCVGRFPARQEILGWLEAEAKASELQEA